jgi:hypothetical protein
VNSASEYSTKLVLNFFAELQGRLIFIIRALYGLKSSGAAWRNHLANTLHSMGFRSSLADPDVWLCPACKPNGFKYYEYLLAYVDDILVLSLDVSPLLNPDEANYYMSQISILRWMVELGCLDIYINVALLSSFLCQPRRGHMEAIYSIYGYLKHHDKSTMVFDDSPIHWSDNDFPHYDWEDFYKDAQENIPPNAPEPRGIAVQINAFVDANHARNRFTRRSHTGILIYLNTAPTIWFSKAQTTVESSTFGSEFVAMRIATDLIEGLRYKLRMFGVPLDGPVNVVTDNSAVVQNSTIPSSTIKKKHNSICYHRVREAIAAGTIRVAHIPSTENLADMFTKPLPAVILQRLLQHILY